MTSSCYRDKSINSLKFNERHIIIVKIHDCVYYQVSTCGPTTVTDPFVVLLSFIQLAKDLVSHPQVSTDHALSDLVLKLLAYSQSLKMLLS